MTIQFHPIANAFPLIEGKQFDELVADVRQHGLREPIVLLDGKILDGRNRYRACTEASIKCRFETYTGDDPVGYVVSLNLRRRHLDESQRAMVAARLATMRQGERTDLEPSANFPKVSQAKAAELLNVSDRTLRSAKVVQDCGAPELVHEVEAGRLSVSVAADISTLSPEQQREIVAQCDRKVLLREAAKIRAEREEARQNERIVKLVAISNHNAPLVADRRFPVIYADPPWERDPGTSTPNRKIENHYPTLSVEAICALPVGDLATDDAILFLWCVNAELPGALEVISAIASSSRPKPFLVQRSQTRRVTAAWRSS